MSKSETGLQSWRKQGKQGSGSGLDIWSSKMEQKGRRLELGTGMKQKYHRGFTNENRTRGNEAMPWLPGVED